MKTSITTFQERVQGNLHFPILTKFGIIDDTDLGRFVNMLDDEGYDLTTSEFNALAEFLEKGTEQGWREKILYMMPFIGSSAAPSAVACPLIANVGEAKKATLGMSGSYDASNDYDSIAEYNGNRAIGITGGNKVLSLHMSALDLFAKTSDSPLANASQYGLVIYGDLLADGVVNTVFGVQPSGLINEGVDSIVLAGINIPKRYRVGIFGLEINAYMQTQNGNKLLMTSVVGTNRNLWRWYFGEFNDIQFAQDAERDFPSAINTSKASTSRVTVGGAYLNDALALNASQTLRSSLRFFSLTDGTLTEVQTRAFALELEKLLSAFGKLY